ncbi:MAG TPA: DipZ protein [Solirubrobacteraceae bacterium]|nr:DipZ protein [Solirubrobacteraceae bacterium]
MRPPVEIAAPPFPRDLPWVNVAPLRMDKQVGRPVLVEFWDACRANSMRTLPYVREWHRRYAEAGLRVVGVHTAGFPASEGEEAVRAAVDRLGIDWPVVVDVDAQTWRLYENRGWPARYLWDQGGRLFDYHYGEGAYDETERGIQELLGIEAAVVEPRRPEDAPGAELVAQSPDRSGPPFSGPYAAGGVWGVLDGTGDVRANDRTVEVAGPGAYPLVEHERHTEGELELEVGDGVTCWAVQFTPGVR